MRGIWLPITISLTYMLIIVYVFAEDFKYQETTLKSLGQQYLACLLFIAFPIFFLNRINSSYIVFGYKHNRKVLFKTLLPLFLSFTYSLSYIILISLIFLLEGIPIFRISYSELFLSSLLYSSICAWFFSSLLNIKNSGITLFITYFIPIIIGIINAFTDRLLSFSFLEYLPFDSDISNHNNLWTYFFYLVLFLGTSIKTYKPYHF